IGRSFHDDCHSCSYGWQRRLPNLVERKIDRWRRRIIKTKMLHVADHTDDLHTPRRLPVTEIDYETLFQRIIVAHESLFQGFVDDCDGLGSVTIKDLKLPPPDRRNAEHFEIVFADPARLGARCILDLCWRIASHNKIGPAVYSTQWQSGCHCCWEMNCVD